MKHHAFTALLSLWLASLPLNGARAETDPGTDSSAEHYTYTLTILGEPVQFSLPAPNGEWLQHALDRDADRSHTTTVNATD